MLAYVKNPYSRRAHITSTPSVVTSSSPQPRRTVARQIVFSALISFLAIAVLVADAQKTGNKETMIGGGPFVASDFVPGQATYPDSNDALNKVESQLFGALELLEAYREAAPIPMKFAEKRRNKFEFIRFGRR